MSALRAPQVPARPDAALLRPQPPASSAAPAVHLLSLRAQLQQGTGSKPVIAATLNESGAHDGSRCCAVAWVPRSGGAQFLVAHASGNILVYKKVRAGSSGVCGKPAGGRWWRTSAAAASGGV